MVFIGCATGMGTFFEDENAKACLHKYGCSCQSADPCPDDNRIPHAGHGKTIAYDQEEHKKRGRPLFTLPTFTFRKVVEAVK
jgi:hypothetical protein